MQGEEQVRRVAQVVQARRRRLSTAIGYAFLGSFFVFIYGMTLLAYLLAYQYLAGPYCETHRMRASDTCSVLHVNGLRGGHSVEHLNHPGDTPPELTLPPTAHPSPDAIIRGVYSPAAMQRLHHSDGLEMLAFGVALTPLVCLFTVRFVRARRASRTMPAVPDE
ncbi:MULTISPECIES: hypothetical protein [unclassified Mycobacterium]|uniref:hypothetical protein n=1 Tax=unclassified Mycobacterium TaxID=2642494 RepID=UPI0007FFB457|nr:MULTISPECIES: hypothetical protein [unclassified Mycobacterium]OBG76430.1 hypothetical protein A5700_21715 [Mycobacterium sp. E1214]OBH24475.1 hypothetical protein A5693_07955 [Mycobacterium sp. E1319]